MFLRVQAKRAELVEIIDLPAHTHVQEKFRINSAPGKDISEGIGLVSSLASSRLHKDAFVGGRRERSTFCSSDGSFLIPALCNLSLYLTRINGDLQAKAF